MRPLAEPAATDYQAVIAAAGFSLGVRCDEDEIHRIDFLPPTAEVAPGNALAAEAARQIGAYLADAEFAFDLASAPIGDTVPAPRLAADRGHPDAPDAQLRRHCQGLAQRTAGGRPGLWRESLPGRRSLPSGPGGGWRTRRIRAAQGGLSARRQALVAGA
jgi:hypothetical protein